MKRDRVICIARGCAKEGKICIADSRQESGWARLCAKHLKTWSLGPEELANVRPYKPKRRRRK